MSVPDYRKTIDELAATPDGSILTKAAGAITSMTGVTWTQAGVLLLPGRINLPTTTGADVGVISVNSVRFLHSFGTNNVFAGPSAGNFTLTGTSNTGLGNICHTLLSTGAGNTAVGANAQRNVTTGLNNTSIGHLAQNDMQSSQDCVAIGVNTQSRLTNGNNSVAVGSSAQRLYNDGTNATSFNSCTHIGTNTRVSGPGATNETVIGASAFGGGSNTVTLGTTTTRVHVFNMRVYNGWTDPDNGQWLQLDNPNSGWTRISAQANGTGAANIGIAISPRGTGAISAHVPDNTATGGNARGNNAVDLQTFRLAASQVASGVQSTIAGGDRNTASGLISTCAGGRANTASTEGATVCGGGFNTASGGSYPAVCGGINNLSNGAQTFVGGGSENSATGSFAVVAGGTTNTASGISSWVPGGSNASTRSIRASHAWSGASRSTNGDNQHFGIVFQRETTDATPTILTSDRAAPSTSTTNVMVLPNNGSWSGMIDIQGRDTSGNVVTFLFKIIAKRGANAASTTIPHWTLITFYRDAALSTVPQPEIIADTTLGAWVIRVTGIAATTIDWIADVTVGSLTHR